MKKSLIYFLILVLGISFVFADAEYFAEAKSLIDSKISCNKLTENQLEVIGDYLMEQMHPGESHELMDKMMGGEGSESLRQMHIAIAKRIYCNDISGTVNYGMMGGGMMNMMMGSNMMGYGMMGNNALGYGYGYWSFWNILYLILLIGLIILVYFGIIKLWRSLYKKDKKWQKM